MKMTIAMIAERQRQLTAVMGVPVPGAPEVKTKEPILPRKVTVAMARTLGNLERALAKEWEFYNKQARDIAERYVKKDESGKVPEREGDFVFASDEDKKVFREEMAELNRTEYEVDVMTFKASELDRCYEADRYDILTPLQVRRIEWMIDDDDIPPEKVD